MRINSKLRKEDSLKNWNERWRRCREQDQAELPGLRSAGLDELFGPMTPLAPALYRLEAEKLSPDRRKHSQHVATYMIHLAVLHDEDPVRFAQVGLLHDLAKERGAKELARLARRDPQCPPALTGGTLHAPAAVTLLREGGPKLDEDALEAIRLHPIAKPNLSNIGMALFLSDKIELTRPFKDIKNIRNAADTSLELAMGLCLKRVIAALERNDQTGHPWQWAALEYYAD